MSPEIIRKLQYIGVEMSELDFVQVDILASLSEPTIADKLSKVSEKKRKRARLDSDGATEYLPLTSEGKEFQGVKEGYLGPWTLKKLRRNEK